MPPNDAANGSQQPLDEDAPLRHVLIVSNPISGRGAGADVANELAEALRSVGARTEIHLTEGPGDGWRWLRAHTGAPDLVVAIGGDGTVREVIAGLTDPAIPVGILPFGTANALAAELDLPRDVHRALEVFRARKTRALDVASVNGSLSLLVTGIGFDARVVKEVAAKRRGPISKLSYVRAAAAALRGYAPPELTVTLDGETLDRPYGLVLVSNVGHYGSFLRLATETRIDDGEFEVYLFPDAGRSALLSQAVRGAVGRGLSSDVEVRRARSVNVTSSVPVPYQVDGDPGGETPVELALSDTQYTLLAP